MRDHSLIFRAASVIQEQFIRIVRASDPLEMEDAAEQLKTFSEQNENKEGVLAGIPHLIPLLSGTDTQILNTMEILKNLLFEHRKDAYRFVNNDGIPPLIRLLSSEDGLQKEQASLLLWKLSEIEEIIHTIETGTGDENGMVSVIALLTTGTDAQKENAMGILTSFSRYSSYENDYDTKIAEHEGIPPIIDLLGTERHRFDALNLMFHLIKHEDIDIPFPFPVSAPSPSPIMDIIISNGGMSRLIQIVKPREASPSTPIAMMLLSRFAKNYSIMIVQEHIEIIKVLITLLSSKTDTQDMICEATDMLVQLGTLLDNHDSQMDFRSRMAAKTAADKLSRTLGNTMTVGALEELFKNLSHDNPCLNSANLKKRIILFLHSVSKIQEIRPHFQTIFTKQITNQRTGIEILRDLHNTQGIIENISFTPDSPTRPLKRWWGDSGV